jgi:hypothetical protein
MISYEDNDCCCECCEQEEIIVRISIPDEDFVSWYKTLREGGLTEEEIDPILRRLNPHYEIECRLAITIQVIKPDRS